MRMLLLALILSLTLFGSVNQALSKDFTVVVNSLPPIKYVNDGYLTGIAGDILIALMDKAEIPLDADDVVVLPFKQAYDRTKKTPNTVSVALAKTPDREGDFKWVGPIYTSKVGFIAKKKNAIQLTSLLDAMNFSIGSVDGSAPVKKLYSLGFPEESINLTATTTQAFHLLAQGKFNLIAFPMSPAFHIMMHEGIDPRDYEMVLEYHSIDLYIAFNNATDDKLIAKLQATLDDFKRPGPDGTSVYGRIVSKYFTPNM